MNKIKEDITTDNSCLYTVITGNYEGLNELESIVTESGVRRICFTDNDRLKSKTWEIRVIKPAFPLDSVRSQRMIKVLPHKYLKDFTYSLYIDNTVRLEVDPLDLLKEYCSSNKLAIPVHSYRNTVYEEFFEVNKAGLDESSRIIEQLNHYYLINSDHLDEKPYWTGIIARKHMDKDVVCLMENWFSQILRYSRRDQLSLNYAESNAGVAIHKIPIDNLSSIYHSWPVHTNRKESVRTWSPGLSGALPLMDKISNLKSIESEVDNKIRYLSQINADVLAQFKPEKVPDGFNKDLYLALNKDVAEAGVDPFKHFLEYGWIEGRRWR